VGPLGRLLWAHDSHDLNWDGHDNYVLRRLKATQTVVSALIKQAKRLPNELYKFVTWDRGRELPIIHFGPFGGVAALIVNSFGLVWGWLLLIEARWP
jgi:hypothetical protein